MNGSRGKRQKTLDLIEASYDILLEIEPATVRAVCYRLFTQGLILNMSKNETNKVSTHLVWARENDHIPWHWVVDETRDAERVSTWKNPFEIISAAVNQYRKDYWQEQPNWVEVWSEKGTMRGTLSPVLEEYGITFRVMHGYGSATAVHDIAEETLNRGKKLTVLYVGDHDPSGRHMSDVDLPNRLERYRGVVAIQRIALTDIDIQPNSELPSFGADTKERDPRHRWFVERYGHRCWEVDALNPVVLRKRIEAAIRSKLDLDAWEHCIEIEKAETASMQQYLDILRERLENPD